MDHIRSLWCYLDFESSKGLSKKGRVIEWQVLEGKLAEIGGKHSSWSTAVIAY